MLKKIAATMLAIFISIFSVVSPAWAQSGNWDLFYDWGCDGSYGTAPLTLATDGTFTTGSGSGLWFEKEGTVVLRYNNSNTVYSGHLVGNSATGVLCDFSGSTGCFYMLQRNLEAVGVEQLDAAGNK